MHLSLCDMKMPWDRVEETFAKNLRAEFGGCDDCEVSFFVCTRGNLTQNIFVFELFRRQKESRFCPVCLVHMVI